MTDIPPPPPPPALWAPRFRAHLIKVLAWMDTRKQQDLIRRRLEQHDSEWRQQYTAWWLEHGWHEGADHPTDAFRKIIVDRMGVGQR